MAYRRSSLDRKNTAWFNGGMNFNSLKTLSISKGNIRSITPVEIVFNYPITAIVGENGAGKSTILALVSCAFNNESDFTPQNKVKVGVKTIRKYYTYGDFFTFSPVETGLADIEIKSGYLDQNGLKYDIRKKKSSGKWNDYNRRPKRAVAYLGIQRIVPPSESSPHRHYCKKFREYTLTSNQLDQLKSSMTAIIGRNYDSIELDEFNSYRLFKAERRGIKYTGFNMGAGENAVLGLLLEILGAGRGALIVVDEIELGLHVQAQIRLMNELKKLCKEHNCQIICSTHSKYVLNSLPPEARIFIKRSDSATEIIPNISSEYAFGMLSGYNSEELLVLENVRHTPCYTSFLQRIQAKAR